MIKVAFTFALILLCIFSCSSYEINTNNIQNDNEIADTNSKIAVSVASDNMYSFEFTNADRTNTMLTFEKKEWDVWNIHSLYIDGERIAGGGSDWEYVLRFNTNYPKNAWDFFGGSHGKEAIRSFSIYDKNTMEEITPLHGSYIYADEVLIVEETYLHFADSTTSICDISREYILKNGKIELNVTYYFPKDAYLYLSYTCMLPLPAGIAKTSKLYLENKSTQIIDFSNANITGSSTTIHSGYPANVVEFNGTTQNGNDFSITTEVYTLKDSCDNFNSNFKTAIYNLESAGIKLYFGKYDEFEKVAIPKGTQWHTKSSWTLNVE